MSILSPRPKSQEGKVGVRMKADKGVGARMRVGKAEDKRKRDKEAGKNKSDGMKAARTEEGKGVQ